MPVMSKPQNTSFEQCEEGTYRGALVDIVDMGYKESFHQGQSKGLRPRVQLVWMVDVLNAEGKPMLVFDRTFNFSFVPNAVLYQRLAGWLGQATIDRMIDTGADMDELIGRSAMIQVEHDEWQGEVRARPANVMALMKGLEPFTVPPDTYTRRCERDDWEQKKPAYSAYEPLPKGIKIDANGRPVAPENSGGGYYADGYTNGSANAAQTQTARITAAQKADIVRLAEIAYGPEYKTAVRDTHLKGHSINDLTADEAAQLIHNLRRLPEYSAPVVDDADDDSDPFADVDE